MAQSLLASRPPGSKPISLLFLTAQDSWIFVDLRKEVPESILP